MKDVAVFHNFENDGVCVVTVDDVVCVRDVIYEDSCWDLSGKTNIPRSEKDGKPCTLIIGRGYDVYVKDIVRDVIEALHWEIT